MHLESRRLGWGLALVLTLPGCRDDQTAATSGEDATDGDGDVDDDDDDDDADGTADGDDDDDDDDDDDSDDDDDVPPPPTSPRPSVKRKGPTQLRNDFAQALDLPPDALCTELDSLSCTDEVHTVTLGGVEPDDLGIYAPAEHSAATTPIAVDRVALAACGRRVDADLQGTPVIFDVPLSGAALADADDPAVTDAIVTLYRRVLLRDPTTAEIEHVRDLYDDVAATSTDAPARDWAVGACFAVLTTMESLFY